MVLPNLRVITFDNVAQCFKDLTAHGLMELNPEHSYQDLYDEVRAREAIGFLYEADTNEILVISWCSSCDATYDTAFGPESALVLSGSRMHPTVIHPA